jgi:hypothetical protein
MLLQGVEDFALVDPMYYDEMDKEPASSVPMAGKPQLVELGNRGICFNQ